MKDLLTLVLFLLMLPVIIPVALFYAVVDPD